MPFWVRTANAVKIVGLKNVETDVWVNDATITAALFNKTALTLDSGAIESDPTGGKVNIKITGHGLVTGDYGRIFGTLNYDGEHSLTRIDNDIIQFTDTWVDETFDGVETLHSAVKLSSGTWPKTCSYVAASNGNYIGQLPKEMQLTIDTYYLLFITEISGSDQVLIVKHDQAEYKGF